MLQLQGFANISGKFTTLYVISSMRI